MADSVLQEIKNWLNVNFQLHAFESTRLQYHFIALAVSEYKSVSASKYLWQQVWLAQFT